MHELSYDVVGPRVVAYMRLGLLMIERTDNFTRYAFTSLAVLFFGFDGDQSSNALSLARVARF